MGSDDSAVHDDTAPKLVVADEDVVRCFDVMAELRPHLDRASFLNTIRRMEEDGFQLAFIEDHGQVVSVAGFRIYTNLSMGKHLYVDDLVTAAAARSKGYGETMIRWLRNRAIEAGCAVFNLDSGTQRTLAHKFYFKQSFEIVSFHFSEKVTNG